MKLRTNVKKLVKNNHNICTQVLLKIYLLKIPECLYLSISYGPCHIAKDYTPFAIP